MIAQEVRSSANVPDAQELGCNVMPTAEFIEVGIWVAQPELESDRERGFRTVRQHLGNLGDCRGCFFSVTAPEYADETNEAKGAARESWRHFIEG
jgi:hypothetical protein